MNEQHTAENGLRTDLAALAEEWRHSLIECEPSSPRDLGWGQGAEHALEAIDALLAKHPSSVIPPGSSNTPA